MIKEKYKVIAKLFDETMNNIGCEYLQILSPNSELNLDRKCYGIVDGITLGWMLDEACYWYDCYFEPGNARCDDQYLDDISYKYWLEETTALQELINKIKAFPEDECIEE